MSTKVWEQMLYFCWSGTGNWVGDGVNQLPLTSGHHPFLQAPGSKGLFPPSANPTFE